MRPRSLPGVILALLIAPIAHAAVLTVGADGAFASLQVALNVAIANGEDDNIRVRAGTLVGSAIATHAENRFLEISGGWDATFTNSTQNPADTVLSGGNSGRVMAFSLDGGTMLITGLTFANGLAPGGSGLELSLSNATTLNLGNCVFRDNVANFAPGTAGGAGLQVLLNGNSVLEFQNSVVRNNRATGLNARGAGARFVLTDANLEIAQVDFDMNEAVGANSAFGGGLDINAGNTDNIVTIRATKVRANRISANTTGGSGINLVVPSVSGQLLYEIGEVSGNLDDSGLNQSGQVQLSADASTLKLRNLAIVDGMGSAGMIADTSGPAQFLVTNLTIAGNTGAGFRHSSSSVQTHALSNVVIFGNAGGDYLYSGSSTVLEVFNSIGSDPGTIDPAGGNYRLAAGSTAINQGFNQAIGGLGNLDADALPRVQGVVVDRGAYEFIPDVLLATGFED